MAILSQTELLRFIQDAAERSFTRLDLDHCGLKEVPVEIGRLTNLRSLSLRGNQITALPPEVGLLTNLELLDLRSNQLTALPAEIRLLSGLLSLKIAQNQFKTLPPELCQLTNLRFLNARRNQLTALPPEIGCMVRLDTLLLDDNQLTSLPPRIGELRGLLMLSLDKNQISALPPQFVQLAKLKVLSAGRNQLLDFPPEVCQLKGLRQLSLGHNLLTKLPPEIGQLKSLRGLLVRRNRLTDLPPEIGQLNELRHLHVGNNMLTTLPTQIGIPANLNKLNFERNPLVEPPPEILQQGMRATLAYLRARAAESQRQWVSKVLLVGEGGVGKTSLLRALRGETFDPQEETTHGIRTGALQLRHPELSEVDMNLNTWDFGGQQIYHATHQFFLTTRSLYIVVWNARLGFEQAKLHYWLDTIQARAPESPVLLVATCIEDRPADLPLTELRNKYPQIMANLAVSNRDGTGIERVREAIAKTAASLPLMGERWPTAWVRAAAAVRSIKENSISAVRMHKVMREHRLCAEDRQVLSRWLHELGEIVYFQDDPELKDVVLLQPDWVTAMICRILDSDSVAQEMGVLTRECMEIIWQSLDGNMQEHFLRLMERFDLSYRTLENRDISIVVERLPWEPAAYGATWKAIGATRSCKQVSMKFQFGSTVPAGLPTWFIARSHRFTTRNHWRQGAMFADGRELEHLALVKSDAHQRSIWLTVRGPAPHNFFALLLDGLELTIARFPGLPFKRLVPCPGHNGTPCPYEFDFANLERAIKREKPIGTMQCQESSEMVSVAELLFGIHWSQQDAVLKRLDLLEEASAARHRETMTEHRELVELVQRGFLNEFRRAQAYVDTQCPNVFILEAPSSSVLLQTLSGAHGQTLWSEWRDVIAGASLELQLCCEAPGAWHPVGNPYKLQAHAKWLYSLRPYLRRMVSVLKYAVPLAVSALDELAKDGEERFKKSIEFTMALVDVLPDYEDDRITMIDEGWQEPPTKRAEGSELRMLRTVLDKLDPAQEWGGLRPVLTPEGHLLWLCKEHASRVKV